MRALIIGDVETVIPFRLAGLESIVVSSSEEMYEKLLEVTKIRDLALILVSSRLVSEIRDKIDDLRVEEGCPPMCEVPSATGRELKPVDFRELLKRALGVGV
jgi:vacuolar-type H+-ATPase subunit F/Vma7